jgi:hypothetical protein
MGFPSSTYQLNLSRSCHKSHLRPPDMSLKKFSGQAEKFMSVSPWNNDVLQVRENLQVDPAKS